MEEFLETQIPLYNLTSKAFSNLKGTTRGFLKRAKKRKFITFNVEEIFQNLDTSEADFQKRNIGILLVLAAGIRVGELVTLKHDAFEDNTIKVRRTETRFLGKDGKYVYSVKEFPKSGAGVRTVVIPKDYVWLCS